MVYGKKRGRKAMNIVLKSKPLNVQISKYEKSVLKPDLKHRFKQGKGTRGSSWIG